MGCLGQLTLDPRLWVRRLPFRCEHFTNALSATGPAPYRPRTNGKAERFIQTALREWAYAQAYPTSDHRVAELARMAAQIQLASPAWQLTLQTTYQPLGLDLDSLSRLHN